MKRRYALCLFTFIAIVHCWPVLSQSHSIKIPFDNLLPVTWYQKGLESSLSVWQKLLDAQQGVSEEGELFAILLGKLAFAQFCVQRMAQDKVGSLQEDESYFKKILGRIQRLLDSMVASAETNDFLACARELIGSIMVKMSLPKKLSKN